MKKVVSDNLANFSLVLSILSLFFSFYGLIGLISIIMAFVGLVKDTENNNRVKLLTAIVLGSVSLLYAFLMMQAGIDR